MAGETEWTPSEIAALIEHLPLESAFIRAVNPDWPWGLGEILQAQLINDFRSTMGGKDVPHIPLPGAPQPDLTLTADDIANFAKWRTDQLEPAAT